LDQPGALKGGIPEKEIAIFELQKVEFPERPYGELPGACYFAENAGACPLVLATTLRCQVGGLYLGLYKPLDLIAITLLESKPSYRYNLSVLKV
jgi:hypothetical protein